MNNFAAITSSYLSNFLKPFTLAMTDYSSGTFRSPSQNTSYSNSNNGMQFKKFQRFFKKSPLLPFIVVVVIVFIIAIVGLTSVIRKSTTNVTPSAAQGTAGQVSVAKPVASQTLNKTFEFPLKDATGKEVSKIQYQIQSAEFDNQIIIKGQEATAVQGKTFLVINLKITNNYDKAVQLNTRDYIRLIVDNDSTQKLAADIHNDPVDVEAISTKFTRLGFPVDINAKSLVLEVGEIDGAKQTVPLNLK